MPERAPFLPGPRPVAVVPLWRRGEGEFEREECGSADRPGVLRGHPGPAAADQEGKREGEAGFGPAN